MSNDRILNMITRISPAEAVNIDDILAPFDPRAKTSGNDVFPAGISEPGFPIVFKDPETVAIGVRIKEKKEDIAVLAARLAGYALEQGAEVIVLSHLDYSGLERFGFRSERICGETEEEKEACENQIAKFWSLEVII